MELQTRRHFADRRHPLVKTEHRHTEAGHCSICLLKLAGLRGYGCYFCNIHVHSECADHFKENISFFAHPSHTLKLSRIVPSGCERRRRTCDICGGDCPPGSFVYRCIGCGFDVHSLCAMLPETVGNLQMVFSSSAAGCCSGCRHPLQKWRYECSSLGLRLHVTCAIVIDPNSTRGDGGPAAGIHGAAAQCRNHGAADFRRRGIGSGPAGQQGWYYGGAPAGLGGYFGGPVFQGGGPPVFQGVFWPPPPMQGCYYYGAAAGVPFIQGGYCPPPPIQGNYYPPYMPGGYGDAGGNGNNIFGNPTSGLMTGIANFLFRMGIDTVAGDFASQFLSAILGC